MKKYGLKTASISEDALSKAQFGESDGGANAELTKKWPSFPYNMAEFGIMSTGGKSDIRFFTSQNLTNPSDISDLSYAGQKFICLVRAKVFVGRGATAWVNQMPYEPFSIRSKNDVISEWYEKALWVRLSYDYWMNANKSDREEYPFECIVSAVYFAYSPEDYESVANELTADGLHEISLYEVLKADNYYLIENQWDQYIQSPIVILNNVLNNISADDMEEY